MSATSNGRQLPPGYQLSRAAAGSVRIGRLLAQGGLGFVYEVAEDPTLVLKQIRSQALARSPGFPERVRAMIANRPAVWRERTGHVVLAWPSDIALDGSRFVGFLMPRIDLDAAVELHNVANPSDRHDSSLHAPNWLRGFTWRYHLRVASNLALVTANLHDLGYVIGDFNERDVLVTSEARVTLVGCDSMQVPNGDDAPFLCTIGVPELTAPELWLADLASTPRRPSSDAFPLAVLLHKLLLQNAGPFEGVWRGSGDKPGRTESLPEGSTSTPRSNSSVHRAATSASTCCPRVCNTCSCARSSTARAIPRIGQQRASGRRRSTRPSARSSNAHRPAPTSIPATLRPARGVTSTT